MRGRVFASWSVALAVNVCIFAVFLLAVIVVWEGGGGLWAVVPAVVAATHIFYVLWLLRHRQTYTAHR